MHMQRSLPRAIDACTELYEIYMTADTGIHVCCSQLPNAIIQTLLMNVSLRDHDIVELHILSRGYSYFDYTM